MSPYVALESTVIAHGLPHPQNVELALRLEATVRTAGAIPRTIGIIGGEITTNLSEDQIRYLAQAADVRKASWRDLPVVVSKQQDGATTVAATIWIAHRHGLPVMATGGIGGVHRSLNTAGSFDISNDLEALAQVPITVVCSGAKAILDLPATREMLETRGVTVIGYQTDEMPAFYSRRSGLPVDLRCDTPQEVTDVIRARQSLDLPGATLVTVPIPGEAAIPRKDIEPVIERALQEATERGLQSGEVTPFLLDRISALTGERSLKANLGLLENNARVAAEIACALAEQSS